MKNKKRKKQKKPYTPPQKQNLRPARRFNWRNLIMLVGNTIIIFGIYRFAMDTKYFLYVMGGYLAALTALVFAYVIYNRGFSRNGITIEMLPDTMTLEEKEKFISDAAERRIKSKWMLTVIFPFIFTFGYEVLELFTFDYIGSLIGG